MVKDILVVRPSKQFEHMTQDDGENITNLFGENLKEIYIPLVIFCENETNQTTFEIIRN